MELITRQLRLRPFRRNDITPLFNIQHDREAMKFTFNVTHLNESESFLTTHARQQDIVGFAPWTICLKEDNTVVGWGGLMEDPFDPGYGPEVVYFFHRDYWGKGFASELVKMHPLRTVLARLSLTLLAHLPDRITKHPSGLWKCADSGMRVTTPSLRETTTKSPQNDFSKD